MNATSAACCDDDADEDEDGEAADMEGIHILIISYLPSHTYLVMKLPLCFFQTLTPAVFSEYEESGLLETDEVDASKGGSISLMV